MKIVRLYFLRKIKTYICESLNKQLEATTLKETYSQKVPLCGKTERGHSQTGTVHIISVIKTPNNCSNYLPLSSTWMSLQNENHSHCQNLAYEPGFAIRKLF